MGENQIERTRPISVTTAVTEILPQNPNRVAIIFSNMSASDVYLGTIRAISSTGVVIVADGDTLFARNLEAGEAMTWKSDYRFRINIAQKENVELFVAGQRLKPLPGDGSNVSDFEINQLNYQGLLLTAQPAN